MSRPLQPFGLFLVSAAAMASTACSPAPSKDPPGAGVAVEVVDASAAAAPAAATVSAPPTEPVPELIRVLAAAPEGLSITSGEGARISASLYDPDDCADLGRGSEGPELPFERYCVWPRDPGTSVRPEVLTGIEGGRVVSVALVGHAGTLPGWDCEPAPTARDTELCVATGTAADQKARWNTAWNNFVSVFVNR